MKRAAVIGLGGMGRRHISALQAAGLELCAVCDASEAALEAGGGARRYRSVADLLAGERGRVEVLTVATNGPSHHEIVMSAAGAGVPFVLCEKPLATSGAKARAMLAECERRGTRLAVNLARRFDPAHRRLKQALCDGVIGSVKQVTAAVGAGGLGCIGTHFFDLVAWLTDSRPAWVAGELDRNHAPNVRGPQFFDPGGSGMVGYTSGARAYFQLSGEIPILPMILVQGTLGHVEIGWQPGALRIFARPDGKRAEPLTRMVQPEAVAWNPGEPLDLVAATRECLIDLLGEHREPTAQAGIDAVDVVIAFHLSSRDGGRRIQLPLQAEALRFEVAIT